MYPYGIYGASLQWNDLEREKAKDSVDYSFLSVLFDSSWYYTHRNYE